MMASMNATVAASARTTRWTTARRITVSVVTALAVVTVASRVNRPARMRLSDQQTRVADQVLAEVRLEMGSLQQVVDSINRVAPGNVRLDTSDLSDEDQQPINWPAPPALRNVRLGTALMVGTLPWRGYDGQVEWREEGGAIVVGGAGTATTPAEGRLYDVRDMLDEAETWSKPLRPPHARPAQQRGLFGGGPDDIEPLQADDIANVIKEIVDPRLWDDPASTWQACGWGGWVFVNASARGHRDVQRLLAMLRRGDSQGFTQKGAGR
jgi:hypothetical protein